MREIQLGSTSVSVQGSPWALFLYEREFTDDSGRKANWHKDYREAYSDIHTVEDGNDEGEVIDFISALDPMFLLKTCWCGAKCADDSTPPFQAWVSGLDVSLAPLSTWKVGVNAFINAELFRFSAQAEEASGE